MSTQVQVPPALAALHNFIMEYDPGDIDDSDPDSISNLNLNSIENREDDLMENDGVDFVGDEETESFGQLSQNPVSNSEKTRSTERRDLIAQMMWSDYLELL